MTPIDAGVRRAVVLALGMAAAAATARYMTPRDRSNDPLDVNLEQLVPLSFPGWRLDKSVVPVNMSADVESALYAVYDAILARTYVNDQGQRVMLSVGYSRQQGGVQKPHWQEICYRAQGFSVSEIVRQRAKVAGRDIPVTRMQAQQGPRVEPVTYWLTLGDHVVSDRWDRLGKLLSMGLRGHMTDGFLVRVSSISNDRQEAFGMQMAFAESLLAAMPPGDQRRLVGLA